MFFQGIDHFHNGTIDAHFFPAVIHIIVAVHHALGDDVQFTWVLAQLAQGIAHQQQGQDDGGQHGKHHQNNAQQARIGVHFVTRDIALRDGIVDCRQEHVEGLAHLVVLRARVTVQQNKGFLCAVFLGEREQAPMRVPVGLASRQIRLKSLFGLGAEKHTFKFFDVPGDDCRPFFLPFFVFLHLGRFCGVEMQRFGQAVLRGRIVHFVRRRYYRNQSVRHLTAHIIDSAQLHDKVDAQNGHQHGQCAHTRRNFCREFHLPSPSFWGLNIPT